MNVGYDGAHNWASSLKVDLSSIPAGSVIASATLQLTESGCLTGTTCATSAIDVYPAQSAISSGTTGVQLAAAAIADPYTATSPATQGTWDITGMVDEWMAGDLANNGLVIAATAAGTAGITCYSPTAQTGAGSLPQVTIGYIPPAVPSAPSGLTATAGDGGALVHWSAPVWNYNDDTDTAIRNFTVKALTSGGAVAATQTASGDTAVLTGLTNGASYTFTVTATNAIGTGPAATSGAVTPTSVPGGPAEYTSAVSQLLNAQDALNNGTAVTADGALSGDSMASADTTELSNENIADASMAAQWAANDEQVSNDSTTLSHSLAMLSPDGTTVSTYTTATETYTITDTSGTTQSYTAGGLSITYSASRALHFGGGQGEVGKQNRDSSNDRRWYIVMEGSRGVAHFVYWSHSWSVSRDLAQFFVNNSAHFMRFGRSSSSTTNVRPGMIIFAALGGGWFGKIDHAGVVVKVLNRNVMIAQHSPGVIEPLWKTASNKGWFGKTPKLQHVWIGDPSANP